MRKALKLATAIGVAGLLVGLVGPAFADGPADPVCSVADPTGQGVAVGQLGDGGAPGTSGGVQVCIENNQLPVTGTVTAEGDATGPSGSLVADGNESNDGALKGYIGAESDGSSLSVVGCADGTYDPSGPAEDANGNPNPNYPYEHNVIWSTNDPTTAPDLQSPPCAVESPVPTP